jgi:UDP-glucose 4-epimerase
MNKMTNKQKILITGGAGYIGSHTCVVLLEAGFDVAVVDNLCNSSREALRRVESITGKSISFHEADIRDGVALSSISLVSKQWVSRWRSHSNTMTTTWEAH